MRPFDATAYMKGVLAPAIKSGDRPDAFARYDLSLDEAQKTGRAVEQEIAARVEQVPQFWSRHREHPRYGELCEALLREHPRFSHVLRDPERRRQAAAVLAGSESEASRDALRSFDELIAQALDSVGRLPRQKRAMLEEYARNRRIPPELARRRLDAVSSSDDETRSISPSQLTTLRGKLRALAEATGEPARGLTAFHALGFSSTNVSVSDLERRCREVDRELLKRPHQDRVAEALKGIIGFVRAEILREGTGAYLRALKAQVEDEIAGEALAAMVDGRIDSDEFRHLVSAATERGLTDSDARSLVREMAGRHGVVVELDQAPAPPHTATPVPPSAPSPAFSPPPAPSPFVPPPQGPFGSPVMGYGVPPPTLETVLGYARRLYRTLHRPKKSRAYKKAVLSLYLAFPLGLLLGWLTSIPAVILGYKARQEIANSQDKGGWIALTGIILGIGVTVLWVVLFLVYLAGGLRG